ncbi:MAG: hypothetical protein H8E59_10775 [Actinobacteria bacterium]|nr:hypothetical protein [Actinomycetota bacterium]
MLGCVAEELARIVEGELPVPESDPLPVTSLLERIDAGGDPVLGSFMELAPALPWTQTRVYLDALPAEFIRNYGYVRLVGSTEGAVVRSDRVAVGVGVWGAGLHYPRHAHPAEEAYHVLAGEVGFAGADGIRMELSPGSPGDFAHNAPDEPHEIWFGGPGANPDQAPPCVLLWAWIGEIGVDARLVD